MLNFLKKGKEKKEIEYYLREVDLPTVVLTQICAAGFLRAPYFA